MSKENINEKKLIEIIENIRNVFDEFSLGMYSLLDCVGEAKNSENGDNDDE